jgi:hypothetical protein
MRLASSILVLGLLVASCTEEFRRSPDPRVVRAFEFSRDMRVLLREAALQTGKQRTMTMARANHLYGEMCSHRGTTLDQVLRMECLTFAYGFECSGFLVDRNEAPRSCVDSPVMGH